jgi:DNA-binding HxlR family transcriptional regulator
MNSLPKPQRRPRPRRAANDGVDADLRGPAGRAAWMVTTQEVVAMLSRKWALPVMRELASGTRRHFQLRSVVKGVSPKVLTETLRFLERNGVIARVLSNDGHGSASVAYALTELGRSLGAPMAAIYQWGRDHLDEVEQSRQDTDALWAGGELPRGARGTVDVPKNPLK